MIECSICLTNNIIPFNKCITQCNHNFCKNCLDTWFDKGKNTCPMCRQALQYFNYNGENTRIISIEKPRVIPPVNLNNRTLTITRNLYTLLLSSNMILTMSNALSLYWIFDYCD